MEFKGYPYHLHEALKYDKYVKGGYEKDPILLQLNPKGLVPTLMDKRAAELKTMATEDANADSDAGRPTKRQKVEDHGTVPLSTGCAIVCDSLRVLEYIQEAFPGPSLLPATCVSERHRCREMVEYINRKIIPKFYSMLMKQTGGADFADGLQVFLNGSKGPFFLGENLSYVDIALFPWMDRLEVLEHYKPGQWSLPPALMKTLGDWRKAMEALPAVSVTRADRQKLIESYERYATAVDTGLMPSQVGVATIQGTNLP